MMNPSSFFQDRPVAFHPDLAKALGSINAALFLCQLLYWQGKGNSIDGWIFKTQEEFYRETALSRWEQQTARKVLRKKGILQECKRGTPAKMYYKVNITAFDALMESYYAQTSPLPSNQLQCCDPTNANVVKPHSIYTEITTEITTENNNIYNINEHIVEIWKYYCDVVRPCRLTEKRKEKIRARLREYSPEDLKRAIDNLAKDDFIMGKNPNNKFYATIEYVFRNTEKTEEWINKFNIPQKEKQSVDLVEVYLRERSSES